MAISIHGKQEIMPWLMGNDVQFIMLGTGRQELEEFLRASEANHKEKVRGWVGFSVPIAHKVGRRGFFFSLSLFLGQSRDICMC